VIERYFVTSQRRKSRLHLSVVYKLLIDVNNGSYVFGNHDVINVEKSEILTMAQTSALPCSRERCGPEEIISNRLAKVNCWSVRWAEYNVNSRLEHQSNEAKVLLPLSVRYSSRKTVVNDYASVKRYTTGSATYRSKEQYSFESIELRMFLLTFQHFCIVSPVLFSQQ
jgi:hypothetical protein